MIVSIDDQANYRVRGYLSTHVERGKTSITWVWDVYGADMRRVTRITGEEPSDGAAQGANTRNDWAAVDDRMLRRIAQSGMDRILVFLNSTEPVPASSAKGAMPGSTIPGGEPPPS